MANDAPRLVTDYYRRCVPAPPSTPRGTVVEQTGEIRLAPDRPWMPFTAEQLCFAEETRFVWRARFKMAPLVTGVVEDAYENGRGRLDAKVWGVLPVAHARGIEVDRGEAQRYLAELVWCPMALVHNDELNFSACGDRIVRVWAHDEQTYVDLVFDDDGDIVGAQTSTRSRGATVQPWAGRFSDFRDFAGVRAPSRGEVRWETPEGPFAYWRADITSLRWQE